MRFRSLAENWNWFKVLCSKNKIWIFNGHDEDHMGCHSFFHLCFISAGWGGPGGYVYQKAYLEFFCSPDKLQILVEKCKSFPRLTYVAVNKGGNLISNVGSNDVNAVTWGVFPAKQIIQPTVVDPASFFVWKDEAFEIWSRGWASFYPEGDPSRKLLQEVSFLHKCYITLCTRDFSSLQNGLLSSYALDLLARIPFLVTVKC